MHMGNSNKEFAEFLAEKAKSIHNETWDCFDEDARPCRCNYERAKAKEILIGEITRKYVELFGDCVNSKCKSDEKE